MTIALNKLERVLDLTAGLSAVDQLRLIERLIVQVRTQQERESAPIDMLSLAGMGAELWRQIDVDAYLEQERANWEN